MQTMLRANRTSLLEYWDLLSHTGVAIRSDADSILKLASCRYAMLRVSALERISFEEIWSSLPEVGEADETQSDVS